MPLSSILDGNEKSLHSKALLPMSLHKTTATTAAATTTTAAAQHRSCFYFTVLHFGRNYIASDNQDKLFQIVAHNVRKHNHSDKI